MHCVTVLSVLFIVSGLVDGQEGKCKTADGGQGQCKSLFNCEQILEIVKTRTKGAQDLLRRSQCGFLGNTPKVCCPEQDPQPTNQSNQSKNKCKTSMSAFPPDPTTKCCGFDINAGNKIYGGTETAIDEYPWLALIEYETKSLTLTLCGGSLISGRYVLTAAHCVVGLNFKSGRPTRVRLGEYDKDHEGADCKTGESGGVDCTDGAVRIPIEKLIPHPEYKPDSISRQHDIALIRMSQLAPFTEFIRPICLPTTDFTSAADSSYTLTTSGWGAITDRIRSSAVKLYVDLPFVNQNTCQQLYDRLLTTVTFSKGQICAGGEQGKDSCKGDSGGPLMHVNGLRHDVVGIASFGHRYCGTKDVPGVYTKVYEYNSWIRSNIVP